MTDVPQPTEEDLGSLAFRALDASLPLTSDEVAAWASRIEDRALTGEDIDDLVRAIRTMQDFNLQVLLYLEPMLGTRPLEYASERITTSMRYMNEYMRRAVKREAEYGGPR